MLLSNLDKLFGVYTTEIFLAFFRSLFNLLLQLLLELFQLGSVTFDFPLSLFSGSLGFPNSSKERSFSRPVEPSPHRESRFTPSANGRSTPTRISRMVATTAVKDPDTGSRSRG